MDLPIALHTAARAFCANQYSRWAKEHMSLVKAGQDRVGSDYSKAAYSLFPRYRLDEAIEVEVERITGHQFSSLDDARKVLLESGNRAFSSLLQEFQRSPQACVALSNEWRAFEAYISGLGAEQLAHIEPLPYRRVLTKSESEQLRQEVERTLGCERLLVSAFGVRSEFGRSCFSLRTLGTTEWYLTPSPSHASTRHRAVFSVFGGASGL